MHFDTQSGMYASLRADGVKLLRITLLFDVLDLSYFSKYFEISNFSNTILSTVPNVQLFNSDTNGNKLVFVKEKDIGNVTWNIMDIEFSNRNEYEVEQI